MPNFNIVFSGNPRTGPGGGGPDSDFYQEHKFTGTRWQAEKEADRISLEKYRGDFLHWVEPATRLVILSGPSCVGKGPLLDSINAFHPEIQYDLVRVIKSLESRPNGKLRPDDNPNDFKTAEEIKNLGRKYLFDSGYILGDCRGLPQAISTDEIINTEADLLFVELYHTIGSQLKGSSYLKDINVSSVFLSPLSMEEIGELKKSRNLESYIASLMAHKLVSRSMFQNKDVFSQAVIDDNLTRAADAYSELQDACNYIHVLVNHDGEGHPNWNRQLNGIFSAPPIGEAYNVMESFAQILKTGDSKSAEHWQPGLI